jgi:chromosome segregation ATPase
LALKKKLSKTTMKWKHLRKKVHELESGLRSLRNQELDTKAENHRNIEVAANTESRIRETQDQIECLRRHNTAKQQEIDHLIDTHAELESEPRQQVRQLNDTRRDRERMALQLDKQEAVTQDLQGQLDMSQRQFETKKK